MFVCRDAKCGKIQCHSAAKKPKGTNAVPIDTTIKTNGIEVKCRGTYVYSTQDGQGDLPDPGLVMTGTKCGEGKVRPHWVLEDRGHFIRIITESKWNQWKIWKSLLNLSLVFLSLSGSSQLFRHKLNS